MRLTFIIFQIFIIAPVLVLGQQEVLLENKQPNIVFIMADDLGWADLPIYGNGFNESPNIDQLAKEGMRFTNAYTAGAVCSPTRASIMTGQYPARNGIIDFIPGHWRPNEKLIVPVNRTQYLPQEMTCIAESLKEQGYETGYFGKWHLGFLDEQHPNQHGFDQASTANGKFYNLEFKPPKPNVASSNRFSEIITDYGLDFINKNKDQPFFLFLSHFDVHVQLDADIALINKYKKKEKAKGYPSNAIYAAMVEHLDISVGRIMDRLKELNIDENTLFVFYSDNGGLNKRYDKAPLVANDKQNIYTNDSLLYIASSNKPLRGEKGNLYEGGIRVPLIVKWPKNVKQGVDSDELITSVDFFPTFLDITGANQPENQVLDGKSILPELLGYSYDSRRSLFWHYPVYHHGVPASAVRKGNWKLIEFLDDHHVELYDLHADIGEKTDLSLVNTSKTKELKSLLNHWRMDVAAPMPMPNPSFDESLRGTWGIHPHLYNMVKYKIRKPK
ncbi:sulfatase [Arenibacter sp. F26102]|uniref:sulfatase n=1 Tax=Arenibacter sp. F26102 TaxID=2926416 RepID=UPI001FF1A39C|nr:sulfatase [Arenibacter sp. F26102]MCK0148230.1 sulfatase [Arenibacter sp. F26102]